MVGALWARASNRVILDEAEETDKGQILDAGDWRGGGGAEHRVWTLF